MNLVKPSKTYTVPVTEHGLSQRGYMLKPELHVVPSSSKLGSLGLTGSLCF